MTRAVSIQTNMSEDLNYADISFFQESSENFTFTLFLVNKTALFNTVLAA